jgi:hypothetical protein
MRARAARLGRDGDGVGGVTATGGCTITHSHARRRAARRPRAGARGSPSSRRPDQHRTGTPRMPARTRTPRSHRGDDVEPGCAALRNPCCEGSRSRPAAARPAHRGGTAETPAHGGAGALGPAHRRSHGREFARSGAQVLAAARSARSQHRSAATCAHAAAEAMLLLPLAIVGLEGALHQGLLEAARGRPREGPSAKGEKSRVYGRASRSRNAEARATSRDASRWNAA